MENYLHKSLPGAGYPEICTTLGLDPESPIKDVLAEIQRLKKTAAKKEARKSHLKEVKKDSDDRRSDK